MSESQITLSEVSVSTYKHLLTRITHKVLVDALMTERQTRIQFGPLQQAPPLQPLSHTLTPQPMKEQTSTPSAVNSRNASPNTELLTRMEYYQVTGRDVFGNEKVADSAWLFECQNCGRKISGNRFAAHIDRCLGGRQRK